jgi:hypothetical protein
MIKETVSCLEVCVSTGMLKQCTLEVSFRCERGINSLPRLLNQAARAAGSFGGAGFWRARVESRMAFGKRPIRTDAERQRKSRLFRRFRRFAFGVLLASQEGSNFCYVDEHTYYYRLSATSVTRGRIGNTTMMSTYLLEHLDTNDIHAKAAVSEWLSRQGSVSIAEAAAFGMTRDATRWYFSEWHRRKIPTPRGIKRLLSLSLVMSIGKPPKTECPICRKLEARGGKDLGERHLHQLMS